MSRYVTSENASRLFDPTIKFFYGVHDKTGAFSDSVRGGRRRNLFSECGKYVLDLSDPEIECYVAKVEGLKIRPIQTPTSVFGMPQVAVRQGHVGSKDFATEQHDHQEFYDEHDFQIVQFEAARQILMRLTYQQHGTHRQYSRHRLAYLSASGGGSV